MRRPLLALTLALTLAASLVVPFAGASPAETVAPVTGTHAFSVADAFVTVHDGPGDAHVATIDTRLYRPDDATAAHPQPAILMTHGFGGSKLSAEVVNTASFLARHGYVVLTYTAQGFGASSGCIGLQSRTYDVKDARQLITQVLGPKNWVTQDRLGPIVGTVGGSYGGGIQLNLAESDQRIRAIAPFRTWNSLQFSLDPNNWVAPGDPTGFGHTLPAQGVFKREWTSEFFAKGFVQPVLGQNPDCPQGKVESVTGAPEVPCAGYWIALCETFVKLFATGDADSTDKALIDDSSGSTQIDKLRVPTLLVQGQSDTLFNVNDAVATYTALRRNGVPVKMIWNAGGHGGYDSAPGECEMFDGAGGGDQLAFDHCYLPLRTLAFFDHWLRGKSDPSPGFTWFRDWVPFTGTGATTAYGGAAQFPVAGATTYSLSGTSLTTGTPVAGGVTILNPPGGAPSAYTETSSFTGPNASPQVPLPPQEVPGQFADFTSAPFAQDRVSVGVPSVHLQLSHLAPTDLVIFGKVWDVAPDGSATLIHRLIAPARIPSDQLGSAVTIKLIGFAHRFAAGHSVRLTLCTTDLTSYNNPVADAITIRTGPGSTFTLP